MESGIELFENALAWLRDNYGRFRFFTERDIVWTVQNHIIELIGEQNLPYRVFHNFPVSLPGKRQSLCTDLAILNQDDSVEVAIEFKYEPSHLRKDIWPTKFPVVFWDKEGVGKDIERINEFVDKFVAKDKVGARTAYLIFIDEGGYFKRRNPHPGSKWEEWQLRDPLVNCVSVLRAQARR